ncbi:FCD domain-containing protein [Pseudomonas sp. RIT-To-2]|uniref:FCD domain-containing protein n=1 Tax=Pseudomonas sp. RIT-To-2 TaxID=3462541 RepID=UPI00241369E7
MSSTIDGIRNHISDRTFQVGDRLPAEADLVRQYGGGRHTVRDALRFLVNWQLLEIRAEGGIYVRCDHGDTEAFRRRNRAGIRDHLEMQGVMEVEAARFAAQRRSMADIRRLRACLAARGEYSANDELEHFLERDRELHRAIALASHNTAIQSMYRSFSVAVRSHSLAIFADDQLQEPDLAAHAGIVDSIIYGDDVGAAAAARELVQPMIDRLSVLLAQQSRAPAAAGRSTLWV